MLACQLLIAARHALPLFRCCLFAATMPLIAAASARLFRHTPLLRRLRHCCFVLRFDAFDAAMPYAFAPLMRADAVDCRCCHAIA